MIITMTLSWKIQDNLYVINSKLEWFVSGRVSSTNGNEKENVMFAMTPASSCLPANIHLITTEKGSSLFEPNIEKLWNLETIGIKSKDNQEREDLVMFKKTITKEGKRYRVSWPWRTQNHNLRENYKLSLGRLKTQMKPL